MITTYLLKIYVWLKFEKKKLKTLCLVSKDLLSDTNFELGAWAGLMSQSFVLGSGLANKKTVTIQPADKEQGVVLATTKTKKQNKPKVSVNKSILKKEFPRMSKAVANQVILYLN